MAASALRILRYPEQRLGNVLLTVSVYRLPADGASGYNSLFSEFIKGSELVKRSLGTQIRCLQGPFLPLKELTVCGVCPWGQKNERNPSLCKA